MHYLLMYKVTMLYGLKGRSELAMLESYTCTVSRGSVGAGSTSWAKHVNFFGEGSQTRQFWPFGAKLQYFGGLYKVREYFEGFFFNKFGAPQSNLCAAPDI